MERHFVSLPLSYVPFTLTGYIPLIWHQSQQSHDMKLTQKVNKTRNTDGKNEKYRSKEKGLGCNRLKRTASTKNRTYVRSNIKTWRLFVSRDGMNQERKLIAGVVGGCVSRFRNKCRGVVFTFNLVLGLSRLGWMKDHDKTSDKCKRPLFSSPKKNNNEFRENFGVSCRL